MSLGMQRAVAFGRIVSGELPISAIPAMAGLPSLNFARAAFGLKQGGGDFSSRGYLDGRCLFQQREGKMKQWLAVVAAVLILAGNPAKAQTRKDGPMAKVTHSLAALHEQYLRTWHNVARFLFAPMTL